MAICNRTSGGTASERTLRLGRRLRLIGAGLLLSIALALSLSACQLVQGGSWESLGPEQGGIILSIATDPFHSHYVYIGTSTGMVYAASADTGPNLVPGTGLPHGALIPALLVDPQHKGTVYAGTSAGLYVSTDQSVTWKARGTGFPARETMVALAYGTDPATLFAGSSAHGVFASHNRGETWQAESNGLPASSDINALLFEPASHTLFAAVDSVGIFASSDLGSTWSKRSTGLPQEVHALTELASHGISSQGPTIYAGTNQGVYASTDDGASWSISGTGQRQPVYSLSTYVTPTIPGWIYAGTQSDVIRSPNGGHTWSTIAAGLSERVLAVASVPANQSNPSSPPYVIFAGAENLWRYPPETSSATGIASLLVEVLVTLFLFGLLFYFVRRARKLWGAPARAAAGGAGAPGAQESGTPGEVREPLVRSDLNGHARTPDQRARGSGSANNQNSGKDRRKKR
jgi:hypothetical protein